MKTLINVLGLLSLSFAVTAGEPLTLSVTESYSGAKWRAPLLLKSQRTEIIWNKEIVWSKPRALEIRRPVSRSSGAYVAPLTGPQRKLDLIDAKFRPDTAGIVK